MSRRNTPEAALEAAADAVSCARVMQRLSARNLDALIAERSDWQAAGLWATIALAMLCRENAQREAA